MWATLDLLVRREARGRDLSENVEEWLETVNRKIAASADGDKREKRKGRKKSKAKNTPVEGKDEGISKGSTTSLASANNKKKTNHCEQDGVKGEVEEEDGKKGVRTWNPRKTIRSHDRDISNRLEQLMGSSVVNITDRKYMLELQQRIIELHYENTEKRMANRMHEEVEREKRLVLENKMPVSEGSPEISNHPVFTVQKRFEKNPRVAILRGGRKKQPRGVDDVEAEIRGQEEQEKRMDMVSRGDSEKNSKGKSGRDSTSDRIKHEIGSGKESEETGSESIGFSPEAFTDSLKVLLDLAEFSGKKEEGSSDMKVTSKKSFEGPEEELNSPSDEGVYINDLDWGTDLEGGNEGSLRALQMSEEERYMREDEEEKGFMLPESKLATLKYESPLIKELRRAKTVDELYTLADQIVGPVPDCHAK